VITVLAALMFLNVSQLDTESESVLHSSGVLNANVAWVLGQRRAQAVSNSLYEYGALVTGGLGITLAIAGNKLHRASRSQAPSPTA
jgi:hypothetical protein